jgi:hypothetical protein
MAGAGEVMAGGDDDGSASLESLESIISAGGDFANDGEVSLVEALLLFSGCTSTRGSSASTLIGLRIIHAAWTQNG